MNRSVSVHIKGHLYETSIEKDFFRNSFELATSDSSYQVVRYNVTWSGGDRYTGYVSVRVIKGPKTVVNPGNDSLANTEGGLAFDNIVIRQGNNYYKGPAFIIYLTDAATAMKNRKDLAFCYAFVTGYLTGEEMPASAVNEGFTIELTDPSYKLLSFEMELEDEEENLFTTQVTGNAVKVTQDAVTKKLVQQKRGYTIIIKDIKAEKNGKIYRVNDLPVYIK